MLTRAIKPNSDCLYEAAKQLLIWALNKKQEFHDFSRRPDFDRYRPNRRKNDFELRENLQRNKVEFNLDELKPLQKDFYKPHPDVLNRSAEEIQEFHKEYDIKIFGSSRNECPAPIFSFSEIDLPDKTHQLIRNLNYSKPTPIQSQTWPVILGGRDMVGISQTGSGKTLGFMLPGLIHIQNQPPLERNEGPVGLVISPTRELAQQIHSVVLPFAKSVSLRTACVFGGGSKFMQRENLIGAHICIATPGRLMDFLSDRTINLHRCTYCVLDEADRLLDMGFEPQIRGILDQVRPDRQMSMWSATWPNEVENLAAAFLKDFIGIKFGSLELTANPRITQHVHFCTEGEKRDLLLKIVEEINNENDKKTLIFAQTKKGVEYVTHLLRKQGLHAKFIHSDLSQTRRTAILKDFRYGRVQFLVGTNIVARGLDITDIRYVINFDFPNDLEEYVHVIGRTARNDNPGTSHSFFTEKDFQHSSALVRILREANQEVPDFLQRSQEIQRRTKNRYRSR